MFKKKSKIVDELPTQREMIRKGTKAKVCDADLMDGILHSGHTSAIEVMEWARKQEPSILMPSIQKFVYLTAVLQGP